MDVDNLIFPVSGVTGAATSNDKFKVEWQGWSRMLSSANPV